MKRFKALVLYTLVVAALVALWVTTPEQCRGSGDVPAYCVD